MSGDYKAFSDGELCRMVRENDPEAFGELSSRYLRLIRARAGAFQGPSVPEQEDLVQEGFLGLFIAAASFSDKGGASFGTYAGVCIRNRMVSAARKHGSARNRALNESLSLDSPDADELAGEGDPAELLEMRDRLRELSARVDDALTPLEKKVLLLYLGGYKPGRDGEEGSGISRKAFDNAMYRVRVKLRERSLHEAAFPGDHKQGKHQNQ